MTHDIQPHQVFSKQSVQIDSRQLYNLAHRIAPGSQDVDNKTVTLSRDDADYVAGVLLAAANLAEEHDIDVFSLKREAIADGRRIIHGIFTDDAQESAAIEGDVKAIRDAGNEK